MNIQRLLLSSLMLSILYVPHLLYSAASSSNAAAEQPAPEYFTLKSKEHEFALHKDAIKYLNILEMASLIKSDDTSKPQDIDLKLLEEVSPESLKTLVRLASQAAKLSQNEETKNRIAIELADLPLPNDRLGSAIVHMATAYFLQADDIIFDALALKIARQPLSEINKNLSIASNLPPLIAKKVKSHIAKQYWLTHDRTLPEKLKDADFGVSIQDLINHGLVPEYVEWLDLRDHKINSLDGLKKLPNIANLEWLHLDHNNISTIQAGAFTGLASLRRLDLRNNNISTIPAGTFTGLNNLRLIYLDNNDISTIQAGAFTGLANLQFLYLDNSNISTIETGAFTGLNNLRLIFLHNNQLSKEKVEQIKKALPKNVYISFGIQRKPEDDTASSSSSSSAGHPEDSSSAAGGGASSSSGY